MPPDDDPGVPWPTELIVADGFGQQMLAHDLTRVMSGCDCIGEGV